MKRSNSASPETKKRNANKTALDNFKLFYEEVPLELEKPKIDDPHKPKDRLVRRSRSQ